MQTKHEPAENGFTAMKLYAILNGDRTTANGTVLTSSTTPELTGRTYRVWRAVRQPRFIVMVRDSR
jgi:hypothetical protein